MEYRLQGVKADTIDIYNRCVVSYLLQQEEQEPLQYSELEHDYWDSDEWQSVEVYHEVSLCK